MEGIVQRKMTRQPVSLAPGRIAFFLPTLETAGAERVTVLLANGLVERGYSVDVVLVEAKGGFLADLADGVHVVDLKSSRTLFAIPGLASYLRKQRPAVVVAALDYVNVAAIIAGRLSCSGTPVVTAVHTSRVAAAQRVPGVRARVFQPFQQLVLPPRRCDHLRFAWRSGGHYSHRRRSPRARSRDLQPRHSPRHSRACAPARRASLVCAACVLAGRVPALVGRGALAPQKDFPTLLRALKIVRRDHDVRLMILGEGKERPRLESLAKELCLESYVSMPGIVKNPYAYMARADLFVLSSAWEALPTVLIEALAVRSARRGHGLC